MLSWATQRRLLYGGGLVLIIGIIGVGVYFKNFYKAPTCFDAIQNGDERGVDCGGSCNLLCKNDTLPPVVMWSKSFNISGDVYSAVAYVENQNINSENPKATYEFRIYNDENVLMSTRYGEIFIPKNKKFAVFESGFIFKNKKPKYTEFSFTGFSSWRKNDVPEPEISVTHGVLLATTTSPKINGVITNKSGTNLSGVELVAFIIDGKENVITASKTLVENLAKKASQDFVFTWPKPLVVQSDICAYPLDVAVAVDTTASMSVSTDTIQSPFGTVQQSVKKFITGLTDTTQVSAVSFNVDSIVENGLSKNKSISTRAIDNLVATTTDRTNIASALSSAWAELQAQKSDNKKIIVLLTDGIPTEPHSTSTPDNAKIQAESIARAIQDGGGEIYTIAIGDAVSDGFMKNISTDTSHYYKTANVAGLDAVYKKVATAICEKKPNLITVIYRIIPE